MSNRSPDRPDAAFDELPSDEIESGEFPSADLPSDEITSDVPSDELASEPDSNDAFIETSLAFATNHGISNDSESSFALDPEGSTIISGNGVGVTVDNDVEELNLDEVRIDPAWALRVPASLALRKKVLPFAFHEGKVQVASPFSNLAGAQAVRRIVKQPIQLVRTDATSFNRAVKRVFGNRPRRTDRRRRLDLRGGGDEENPETVRLCDEIMHAAVLRQASDIHLDPMKKGFRIRFRVDGVLETFRELGSDLQAGVISRLKVMAGMDIAEKRAPQDGRIGHPLAEGGELDIRVATLPTKHGERMTLRLLALQTEKLTLERLGLSPEHKIALEEAIDKPHGLILHTGPTGSGKSTSLYAALRRVIAAGARNILTVEDPVEYEIAGIAQVEVDSADKVNFSKALRSILRHDPDVIMIGEIRDRDTADVAIKASLTGHLVLSTLHTNTAVGAITRLIDMEVERYLVAATLRMAVAQRLVRQLCQRCITPRPLEAHEARLLGDPGAVGQMVFEPAGCLFCGQRGYTGRLGLFELFPSSEELANAIGEGATETRLIEIARGQGFHRLVDDARAKVLQGVTSVNEVLRTVTVF